MDLLLKDKVIVVTVGSKAGAAQIAEAVAREGGVPVLLGADDDFNRQLAAQIERSLGIAFYATAALTDAGECARAVKAIIDRFARIDGLVNNGTTEGPGLLEDYNPDRFGNRLHEELLEYFIVMQSILPALLQTKGAIVNRSYRPPSLRGHAFAYGGRNALTREWAVDLVKQGIRVNGVISASDTDTTLSSADVAGMVLFLLSARSSHTTGQIIPVG